MIHTYKRYDFKSWDEKDGSVWNSVTHQYEPKTKRAVALCDGSWFGVAINALRDGDMGEEGPDGVYSRKWWTDDIYNAEVAGVSNANRAEVDLYLKHVTIDDAVADLCGGNTPEQIYLIRGAESYVLIPVEE